MVHEQPLRTELYEKHTTRGAQMARREGWELPLTYSSVSEEVARTRCQGSIFDISHLGRLRIRGDGALDLLERLCTTDVAHQEDNTAAYTLLCNEGGGIIADGWLVRAENFWLLTTGAATREKVLRHLRAHATELDVKIDDQTMLTCHLLVAGRGAAARLDAVLPVKPSLMPRRAVRLGSLMIARYLAIRVGWCDEWALEVILPNMLADRAWTFITENAGAGCIPPAGIAARDVLRIEAGLPRYGHELNDSIDPMTAGLEHAVVLNHDFIGSQALSRRLQQGLTRRRVGLIAPSSPHAEEMPVLKPGDPVLTQGGREIGTVTSGTYSPSLKRIVAMAYVDRESLGKNTIASVKTRQGPCPVKLSALPFPKTLEPSC